MWNRPKDETDKVQVHYPHPGQRFVKANELLESKAVREQIERMAELARESAQPEEDDSGRK